MLPAATNFDPAAKGSGVCKFKTIGCTDPAALNYNSFATELGDTVCILPKEGCTVQSDSYKTITEDGYVAVKSDTPDYKSGFHGDEVRGLGKVMESGPNASPLTYDGIVVTNYDPEANVLATVGAKACKPAIEGCMTEGMVNYDPAATVMESTWCVPKKTGCMMPLGANGIYHSDLASVTRDGLARTFDPEVTVHVKSECRAVGTARYGCTDPDAINYDPVATDGHPDYPCYPSVMGCLNLLAQNYGCTDKQIGKCEPSVTGVTKHVPNRCHYPFAPPLNTPYAPSPPPPVGPGGGGYSAKKTYKVEVKMQVMGTSTEILAKGQGLLDAWSEANPGEWTMKVCTTAGLDCQDYVPSRRRQLNIASDTSMVIFTAIVSDPAAQEALSAAIATQDVSAEGLTKLFQAYGIDIQVSSAATIEQTVDIEYVLDGLTTGAVIGLAIGVTIGGLLLIGIAVYFYRNKMKIKKVTVPA